jgi:elongation factor 1-alpha
MATDADMKKKHMSVVIGGHVDSGKSTTTGHLLFKLGGISQREVDKMKEEAHNLGKDSFHFAFFLDKQKEERERGITISCTTKEFFTNNFHYTIIDAPGHIDFIKNFITGSSQADIGVLLVPADSFIVTLQKGNRDEGTVEGQTRMHALLYFLLGIKQLVVCVNKMDSVGYSQDKFNEIKDEVKHMLKSVGWKKEFVDESVPIIPISGYQGDNLFDNSENLKWFEGQDVKNVNGQKVQVTTLVSALDNYACAPNRVANAPLRMPVSGVFKIKGTGDVITGRLEQGIVKAGDEVVFLPTHTTANPCTGRIFSVEMHHKTMDQAGPGDNVGLCIKGLDKKYMPRNGDIMILKSDNTLKTCKRFAAQAQIMNHPGELKVGYSPIGYVRTSHSAIKIVGINWRLSKETGGVKVENPPFIKAGDMTELVFEPQKEFVVEEFKKSEGLGRVAVMDGNSVMMIAKITAVEF